jgi:hypothetical protein
MIVGVTRVSAGVFSLTPASPPDDDGSYLRWHLLDHMPEQYSLPGIVHGQRWTADGDYPDHRIVATPPLDDLGGVVNYLLGEPVQQTYDDFLALGAHLADVGRYPQRRRSLELRLLELLRCDAAPSALVSPEVVPFRPHRGVVLILEEIASEPGEWLDWLVATHLPELLDMPGVAGAWTYRSTDRWQVQDNWLRTPQLGTVVYLDDDPLAVTRALASLVEQRWASGAVRPVFAGPLRTMMSWDAWPSR